MTNQQHEFIRNTLKEIINFLGLEVEIESDEKDDTVVLKLKTPEPGRLIGRKGRTLESIEYLLGRIISQKYEMQPRMRLDVDGYQREERETRKTPAQADVPSPAHRQTKSDTEEAARQPGVPGGRKETLEKMALDIAKEVKRWGEAKTLGPLSVEERKIIHETLAQDSGVITESGPEQSGGKKEIIVKVVER